MSDIVSILTSAAQAVGVSPALLLSVCFAESSLRNVVVPHDGHSASYGVCQLKLGTARYVVDKMDLDIDLAHSTPLMNPVINAEIAAHYLRLQIKRYGGNTWCGVNAYNKGSTRCNKHTHLSRYVRRVRKHMELASWKKLLKSTPVLLIASSPKRHRTTLLAENP